MPKDPAKIFLPYWLLTFSETPSTIDESIRGGGKNIELPHFYNHYLGRGEAPHIAKLDYRALVLQHRILLHV